MAREWIEVVTGAQGTGVTPGSAGWLRRGLVSTALGLAVAGLMGPGFAQAAASQTVVVGSWAGGPADAMRVPSLDAVPWTSLQPGARVLLAPGTHSRPFRVNARGTAAAPIVITAADASQPPLLTVSVDFQGASYVRLKGVVVDGSAYGAVVIRQGSHHIQIKGNTLRRSAMGVNISEGAGTALRIEDNLIEDHQTHGIAIVEVNATAAEPSVVQRNVVRRNGHHGMEVQGSRYLIEGNTVSESGLSMGGTSGIHLYSRGDDGFCDDNIVRRNFSFHNHDRIAYDGNGIQADHWCDRNEISHNVIWGNDGPGINVYDGSDNRLIGNTLYGNALDPKRASWQLGEILIGSQGPQTLRAVRNQVSNNLIVPTRPEVAGLLVDYWSEASPNQLGPNQYAPRPAGAWLVQRGGQFADTAVEVDQVTGVAGNLVEQPNFVNVANPLAHGLSLQQAPSQRGPVPQGMRDMLGRGTAGQDSYIGAYYSQR